MAKKSVSWSKSKNEEKIDKPKEENPSQEKNMDEKQILDLLDKREQKLIETLNKKYGGNTPPGGDKMDEDTRKYLENIGKSVENQGKIVEKQGEMLKTVYGEVYGERERKETDNHFRAIAEGVVEPVIKELKLVKGMVCDDKGNCRLPTKEELATLKTEQDKKLEKIKEGTKKTSEEKPDLSQLSGQELWNQIKKTERYVEDVGEIHIKRVKEDPDYRAKILDTLCDPKNEQCRVDVMEKFNKFSEQIKKTEEEKKTPEEKKNPEDKKFFLDK